MTTPQTSSDLGDLLDGDEPIPQGDSVASSDVAEANVAEADLPEADDDWLTPAPRPRGPRRLLPTVLAAATLLAVAFTGGVLVQKQNDQHLVSATSAAGGFAGGRGGFGGGGFAGGGGAGTATAPGAGSSTSAPAVIGTVVSRQGQVLTVRNLAGKTFQVTVPAGVTVAQQQALALSKLADGSSVVVTGTTSASGAITASTITVH